MVSAFNQRAILTTNSEALLRVPEPPPKEYLDFEITYKGKYGVKKVSRRIERERGARVPYNASNILAKEIGQRLAENGEEFALETKYAYVNLKGDADTLAVIEVHNVISHVCEWLERETTILSRSRFERKYAGELRAFVSFLRTELDKRDGKAETLMKLFRFTKDFHRSLDSAKCSRDTAIFILENVSYIVQDRNKLGDFTMAVYLGLFIPELKVNRTYW